MPIDSNTKFSFTATQLWSCLAGVAIATWVIGGVFYRFDAEAKRVGVIESEMLTPADWDLLVWQLQHDNPTNTIRFPTANEIRNLKRK